MYNPRLMSKFIAMIGALLLLVANALAQAPGAPVSVTSSPPIVGTPGQSELLWQKLDTTAEQVNRELNGTMGIAIMDLTDGRTLLLNPDAVFAQASSIKVAVLAELYRQQQQFEQGASASLVLHLHAYVFTWSPHSDWSIPCTNRSFRCQPQL